MKAPVKTLHVSLLSLLLSACGSSDDKKNAIFDTWETTQGSHTFYVIFSEDSSTTLFLSEEFNCYIQLTEDIIYVEPNTIITDNGQELEYIVNDSTLTFDPDTSSSIQFNISNINLDNLNYCEDPSISGDIQLNIKFNDFADKLRTEAADLSIGYYYSVSILLDMDNNQSRSIGDLEFSMEFESDPDDQITPTLSQLDANINIVTYADESTTSYETISYPSLTFDSDTSTATMNVKRGEFPKLSELSLTSNIGVRAEAFFSSLSASSSDFYPSSAENDFIPIGNLSSSEDAIDDVSGNGEHVNLIDIKSVSIEITE